MLASLDSNMTDAISESGPAYPSGAPGFISGLSWSTCSSLVTSDRSFSHDDIVLSIKKVHHKEDSIFMCSYASVGTASTRGLYIYVFLCVNCNIYVFICVSWYSIYKMTIFMCPYASVGTSSTRGLYIYVFLCVNCNNYVFICVSWYSIYEMTLYLCVPMRPLVQNLRENSISMCSYASVGTASTRGLYIYVFLCVSWYHWYINYDSFLIWNVISHALIISLVWLRRFIYDKTRYLLLRWCSWCLIVYRQVSLVDLELPTLQERPHSFPVYCEVRVVQSLVFCVVYCRRLFVILCVFFWPLYCIFLFYLRLQITSYLQTFHKSSLE
jgi:hypothetical protein